MVPQGIATVTAGISPRRRWLRLRLLLASAGNGELYRGWQSIRRLIGEAFDGAGSIQMTIDSATILPLGDSAAIAYFRYRWLLGPAAATSVRGVMTIVYTRTETGWLVAPEHTSTVPEGAVWTPNPSEIGAGPRNPVRQIAECVASRTVDGDTIECRGIGRVRLIGMDSPERNQDPYGKMAAAALADLSHPGSPSNWM